MNAATKESTAATVFRLSRDPAAWMTTSDVFAILIALALPWSTSLTAIFATAFLLTKAPFLDFSAFLQSLKRPVCAFPVALFALAVIGTLWSDAAWGVRLYAVGPTAKLLVLPMLLYHFERSERGLWVLVAFLVSCTLVMAMSWLVAFDPSLSLKSDVERGIFVKNYIDQSQEFALCAVALAYPIAALLREKRFGAAALLIALAMSFVANMAFVIVSRTALVTIPIMLAVFASLHLKWRSTLVLVCVAGLFAAAVWQLSPQLRRTAQTFLTDYQIYKERHDATSIGLRLEFWQKSLRFLAEAPILGHGTGSTRGLFEKVATGPASAASAEVIGNPHNQTLNVAVQWGVTGIVVLYAMWLAHLLLFRGDGLVSWIGLMVVVQNIFTSLFNSHIFDFHEGWMYVLGAGVAGGMVLKAREAPSGLRDSVKP